MGCRVVHSGNTEPTWEGAMAMETMTRVNEQMDVAAKKPMAVQPGVARMRELTPAQRRAVMFAQQQVLKAQAAKKAKDQRQAVRERMWDEDSPSYKPTAAAEPVVAEEEPREFSLRGAIGHVLRELRTRDRRTLREVSEKAGFARLPFRSRTWTEGSQLRTAELHRRCARSLHFAHAAHGG